MQSATVTRGFSEDIHCRFLQRVFSSWTVCRDPFLLDGKSFSEALVSHFVMLLEMGVQWYQLFDDAIQNIRPVNISRVSSSIYNPKSFVKLLIRSESELGVNGFSVKDENWPDLLYYGRVAHWTSVFLPPPTPYAHLAEVVSAWESDLKPIRVRMC